MSFCQHNYDDFDLVGIHRESPSLPPDKYAGKYEIFCSGHRSGFALNEFKSTEINKNKLCSCLI